MRRTWTWVSFGVIAVVAALGLWLGPTAATFLRLQVVDVDPELKVVLGGGGNSLVLFSEDRHQVLIVDTKFGPGAKRLRAYVDALGPDVKVTVINTHLHPDHTGGNALFPNATLIAGAYPAETWARVVGSRAPDVTVAAGSDTVLAIGSEIVRVRNLGQAHTLDDLVVFLEHRRLLHTGDLVFDGWNPVLRKDTGSNVGSWVRALDEALDRFDSGTVVPGHGPVTDKNALLRMREYFSAIGSALGNPRELAVLRARYAGYFSLPGMSGFDRTVRFIAEERREGKGKR